MFRLGDPWESLPHNRPELLPDHRYSMIRIAAGEFAYTSCERYLRALGQAWAAGLTPDPLPSALGRELSAARALRGIDMDLSVLGQAAPGRVPLL